MTLTNAQRQAKHRAKHVKLSADTLNMVHCALISAKLDANEAGKHSTVASIHHTQAYLYEAEGKVALALNSRALAAFALAAVAEGQGDTMEVDYHTRNARKLTEQARQASEAEG